MADPLRFHPLDATDIVEAAAWFDERSIGLGNRFRRAVDARFDDIVRLPETFPPVFSNFRFARVPRFPFLVLFRAQGDAIYIVGVFHAASDPHKWRQLLGED